MTARIGIIGIILIALTMRAVCQTAEAPRDDVAVKRALEEPWTDLTVSMMIDQGCVAPIYIGLRITRTKSGFSIARWQLDQRGERLGPMREFAVAALPEFLQGVLSHYGAARQSEDIHERIAKLKDNEQREKALADAVKAAGGMPVGGFGAFGIDIRANIRGVQHHFADNYGSNGFEKLERWLSKQGAEHQRQ